jgi:hypothetical protein
MIRSQIFKRAVWWKVMVMVMVIVTVTNKT